ncbi:MAG: LysR family transcriptional regulator [Burkholderiaceae bacterium]|nr:LysR family transcriptional regulator [Burkholderiaceae bacterium]
MLAALRCFDVAARHCHFTRAAAELHLTPGAISQHIRHLEDDLGVALFSRLPRGLALTERSTAAWIPVGWRARRCCTTRPPGTARPHASNGKPGRRPLG